MCKVSGKDCDYVVKFSNNYEHHYYNRLLCYDIVHTVDCKYFLRKNSLYLIFMDGASHEN